MVKGLSLVFCAPALLVLGACASMSADECALSDWRGIGFEDGVRGYTADRLADHRKACTKHGVVPNFEEYRAGHTDGLREFCRPGRGFQLGADGGEYHGMCAADLEPAFVDAWRSGQHLYVLNANVNTASNNINNRKQQLDRTKDRIREAEAALIAAETSTEDRILLLADLKDLSEDVGRLEAEIVALSEERVRYQQERDSYRTVLANSGYY